GENYVASLRQAQGPGKITLLPFYKLRDRGKLRCLISTSSGTGENYAASLLQAQGPWKITLLHFDKLRDR
ncbi:MAG: hypothetical protein ABJB16_11835, partial [Saprospiraceae bacterium]